MECKERIDILQIGILKMDHICIIFIVASVTLMEENYSGVRGEIQLVQHSDSNHVMITGAIKGLSPGIHGIYVQIGNTCFDTVRLFCLILY